MDRDWGFVNNGEAEVYDPHGIIQTGQGFLVEANAGQTAIAFKNAQRSGNNAGQFFRADDVEKHRIWLNATGTDGSFAQMLVGYFTGATLGIDQNIDGRNINNGAVGLTISINDVAHVIEGRPLPFDNSDVVPLTFKAVAAGNYTISINHVDGLFAEDQDIYLRDLVTGITHDLKANGYTFTAGAGTFSSRFELVYRLALGTNQPIAGLNSVVVVANDGSISVNAGKSTIHKIEVFDIRGRLIAVKSNINASESVLMVNAAEQVLIVKITSDTNETAIRKVVNK